MMYLRWRDGFPSCGDESATLHIRLVFLFRIRKLHRELEDLPVFQFAERGYTQECPAIETMSYRPETYETRR